MPRDVSGNYTLPFGNPVAGGTTIDVNWANPTMADIAAQLNNVFTRDGLLGPLDKFKIIDGTVEAPGLTFNSELGLGLFRESQGVLAIASEGGVSAKFSSDGVDIPGTIGKNGTPIALVPTGTILDFAGATAPFGYLLCDGSAVSRTTYATLFAVLGTTWGAGDGSTTFGLPDLRRRTTIGSGGTPVFGPGITLGNVGGAEGVTLAIGNLAAHNHGLNDPQHQHLVHVEASTGLVSNDHTHTGTTYGGGWHQHRHQAAAHNVIWQGLNEPFNLFGGGTMDDQAYLHLTEGAGDHVHNFTTGGINQNHSHYFIGDFWSQWRPTGMTMENTGTNTPFGIMQPSAVVNKIIKT